MPELRRADVLGCFFLCGASLSAPFCFWWEDLQRVVDRGLKAELPAGLGDDDIHEAAARIELLPAEDRDQVAAALRAVAGPCPDDAGIRADAIRAIARAGHEIGFHTRRHYVLTMLDDAGLERELRDGRAELAAVTGKPVRRLAYPHGKADRRVADAARRTGFEQAFTTAATPAAPDGHSFLLGRVNASPVSWGHFALDLARALSRPYASAAPSDVAMVTGTSPPQQ